jgi:hypothetical protein
MTLFFRGYCELLNGLKIQLAGMLISLIDSVVRLWVLLKYISYPPFRDGMKREI